VNVLVGGFGNISTLGIDNCSGQSGINLATYFNSTGTWWSDNTVIANVTAYKAQGVAPGTANGYARATVPSGDGGRPRPPCPDPPQQAAAPVPVQKPHHLQVILDTSGQLTACPSTSVRTIKYQIVDVSNTPIYNLISIREQFNTKSTNTCNTTPRTSESCEVVGGGSFTDGLTVGCNSVEGTCGFTYTHQQWVWCDTTPTVIATPGDLVVRNSAITVGGNSYFPPSTYIYP
jgi:hypothetical protein